MNLRNGIGLLYTLLIVCMGVATIIEKVEGKAYIHEALYGSWWFATLWGLLAVMGLAFLLKMKVHRRWPVFLLHISFLVILAGALITHLTAQSGTLQLRVGTPEQTFTDEHQRVQRLPFSLKLNAFSIQNYPGTDAVMDYLCHIEVEHEGKVKQMNVSMNHIGRAGGYRFYQSAYDSDSQGTCLLVAHDPYGIAVTYVGYLMLLVGFLSTLGSRHTRLRQLYRQATRPAAVVLLALLLPFTASAKVTVTPTPVSSEIAQELGKVVAHYNGRLCPLNTVAQDFVTKLCGKPSWQGYSANEIFLAWMIYYTEWEQQPIIKVKSAEVQRLLGIEGKWACVRDFYTTDHAYKLSGLANDAQLPESTRKAIREVDEKLQVITMFYHSEMLRIFPLALEASRHSTINHEPSALSHKPSTIHSLHSTPTPQLNWYTPGSTDLPLGTPTAEFQFIHHAMDHLVKSVLVNDVEGARQIIGKIKLYQREKAGSVMPSGTMVSMEVLYNRLQSARWVVFLCLTLSLILCISFLTGKQGSMVTLLHQTFIFLQTGFLTLLLTLRWIVSGHVPMSNGYETMLFLAWSVLLITLLFMRKMPVMKAFGPLVASLCMLVSMLAMGSPQVTLLMPVLQSPLLTIHVALVMIAYALLALITLLSVQGLVQSLRHSHTGEAERTLALSQLLLYPAVTLLSFGIFVGAVWANISWGSYWSWDPKETWALITLMIYAIPLHKSFFSVSAFRHHLYILLSFLTVLMTYFGVNYFLSGMHSYA